MIKKHSDDPNIVEAANLAQVLIQNVLVNLPQADSYDYGGHELAIGEYDVCSTCTKPIAEAQQVSKELRSLAETVENSTVREHIELAAELFDYESKSAKIRAEFHNGYGTEKILNDLLTYQFGRNIRDDYQHSHNGGN